MIKNVPDQSMIEFTYIGGEFKKSDLENEYLNSVKNESNTLLKNNLIISAGITMLFCITDVFSFLHTNYLAVAIVLRILLSLICLIGIFSIKLLPNPRHLQNYIFFTTILYVSISGILFFMVPYPDYSIIMAGMIIVLAICVFLPQRFNLATITAIYTSGVFLIRFYLSPHTSLQLISMGTTYLFASNIFGLITYRELNLHKRKSFFLFRNEQHSKKVLEKEVIKRNILEKKLKHQVSRDHLTGLHNRRYLYQSMKPELSRAKRNGQPVSIIFFDLDHFKSINDIYGHKCGDEVLKRVAKTILHSLRVEDIFARIGGEEFVILSPEMNLSNANALADRLRLKIANIKFSFKANITASFGVVETNGNIKVDELMHQADQTMYCAKKSGRNCICSISLNENSKIKKISSNS